MNIELTPDIESALTEQARKMGTTPETLALDSLRERFVQATPNENTVERQETLADFLSGYIGILHSGEYIPGGARMSEGSGKKFAAGMVERRQQGRL